MSKTMIEIAKQKDDGSFAKMGMIKYCADWFNVPYMSKCTEYIVDTYFPNKISALEGESIE